MDASSKAEVMERFVEAWERSDWEAATAIWADDVVHHVPGRSQLAGDFFGKQAFLDHYGRVLAELGGTIEVVEFHDVLVSEDHAVALVKERAVRGERRLEFNRVVVYHLRDGKIAETWSHDYDLYALDEFWS
jgi:ketosteroid isomerase-like protein